MNHATSHHTATVVHANGGEKMDGIFLVHQNGNNQKMTKMTTIEEMIEQLREKETPEQKHQRQVALNKRMVEFEKERVKRDTCSECCVDTGKNSHTFKCSWRGR